MREKGEIVPQGELFVSFVCEIRYGTSSILLFIDLERRNSMTYIYGYKSFEVLRHFIICYKFNIETNFQGYPRQVWIGYHTLGRQGISQFTLATLPSSTFMPYFYATPSTLFQNHLHRGCKQSSWGTSGSSRNQPQNFVCWKF